MVLRDDARSMKLKRRGLYSLSPKLRFDERVDQFDATTLCRWRWR